MELVLFYIIADFILPLKIFLSVLESEDTSGSCVFTPSFELKD